jgi:small-conductance mechanosensitive channel
MLALWDRLHDMGVEIPFPQREIVIKSWPAGSLPAAENQNRNE